MRDDWEEKERWQDARIAVNLRNYAESVETTI
jgi:hypothetical protein